MLILRSAIKISYSSTASVTLFLSVKLLLIYAGVNERQIRTITARERLNFQLSSASQKCSDKFDGVTFIRTLQLPNI